MPGSHGSLTKAGKVRSQTPKVQGREKKKRSPARRNRKNFQRRIEEKLPPGQKDGRAGQAARRARGGAGASARPR